MFRNLLTSLILEERIQTTDAKAKELRRLADRLITLAKNSHGQDPAKGVHARRMAANMLFNQTVRIRNLKGKVITRTSKDALAKLFEQLGPRFLERPGGYTRVIKLGHRHGDGAALSIIEWTDNEVGFEPEVS
jgi:large subunit ribosomal protein L17